MILKNASVFQEDGTFRKQDIFMENGIFTDSASGNVLDAEGLFAIPGLTDIHFHGCVGYDFCDGTEEAIRAMAAYELKNGITTIVPATMTFSEEILTGICRMAADYHASQSSCPGELSLLEGINMEGPFISFAKKGAQNGSYIHKPDAAMFRRLQEAAGGLVKLVDIAPEEEGAMEFIDELKEEVAISLAHTTADYDTAKEAYDRGACHATHLYNAMPPFSHRAPGVIGAACDSPHVRVELICDGIHLHPATVRTTFRMFGDDRIVLISDSMMATGLSDGDYSLGGQPVKVTGNLATLSDGTIAGSATNLMDCLRTAVLKMGIPLGSAVKCAAVNSAKAAGLYDRYGSITPGKTANLVLLDPDLNLKAVYLRGKEVKR
ncbi:MAG: N-acetylglucosamine-6-phosphate deacetylase [Candidatus Limivivens sp.]|nr:N-acetylglucosamine-6-phosphate deacetylase [Candidatus Limivivens sp.]